MHRRVVLEGNSGGWLFTRPNGTRASMSDYNDEFVECIYALHENKPHLFSKSSLLCDKNRSGIPFRKWIGRLMHTRVVREGKSGG